MALTEVTGDAEEFFLRVPRDLCERFCSMGFPAQCPVPISIRAYT